MRILTLIPFLAASIYAQNTATLQSLEFNCHGTNCELQASFDKADADPSFKQFFSADRHSLQFSFSKINVESTNLNRELAPASAGFRNVTVSSQSNELNLSFGIGSEVKTTFTHVRKVNNNTFAFGISLPNPIPTLNVKIYQLQNKIPKPPQTKTQIVPTAHAQVNQTTDSTLFSYLHQKSSHPGKIHTSNTFALGSNPRDICFIKNSDIFELPNSKSKILAHAVEGNVVERLGIQGDWIQVKSKSGLIGFVPKGILVYPDEVPSNPSLAFKKTYSSAQRNQIAIADSSALSKQIKDQSKQDTLVPMNFETKQFVYSSFGRRDPFVPVKLPEVAGISIDEIRLVGIIWNDKDPIAILEDAKVAERSYSLRQGDAVMNGFVQKITPESVIFSLTEFGITRRFAMSLSKVEK